MARGGSNPEDEDRPMGLTDMARDPDDDDNDEHEATIVVGGKGPHKPKTPVYKYGHRISLDHEDLGKLDMEPPKVGDKMHVLAHGEVTSVRSEDHEDGDGKRHREHHVEVQLKKMHVANKGEHASAKDALERGLKDASED
jgi:Major coat protein-like